MPFGIARILTQAFAPCADAGNAPAATILGSRDGAVHIEVFSKENKEMNRGGVLDLSRAEREQENGGDMTQVLS
ncbi:hypothetical protein [Hyphomicrobium sp.]|uniref:hypothetical protein n=1 Tax=Hyphomicrobium sp. TaxID=82 RepID=UPI0025C5408A|nr:hypothetical protein [Hyphomicrobium sp.]MCC7250243.1 hypothetical protein [Hyphomicrobium sp.]